jgi:hypothetical protein
VAPTDVRWTFLPGHEEGDAFAYLDEVRLALREIRLAGGRSIAPMPDAIIDRQGLGPIIRTYSLPMETVVGPILRAGAHAWLLHRASRSLRIKVGHIEIEADTPDGLEKMLTKALDPDAASFGAGARCPGHAPPDFTLPSLPRSACSIS